MLCQELHVCSVVLQAVYDFNKLCTFHGVAVRGMNFSELSFVVDSYVNVSKQVLVSEYVM